MTNGLDIVKAKYPNGGPHPVRVAVADVRPLPEDTYLGTFAYTLEDYRIWKKGES